MIGENIGTLFPHLSEPRYTGRLESIFKGGPPVIFSSQLHKYIIPSPLRDGQLRVQHTTVTPLPAPDGKAFHDLFAIQDITELTHRVREYRVMRDQALEEARERRQAETALQKQTHALRESERRFHTLAKMSPVGIFRTDAKGCYLYVNERWCEITGLALDNVRGNICWMQGVHPDDDERITERKRAAEALRQAHDELEMRVQERTAELAQANKTLREYAFIANASREFMTLVDQNHTCQAANNSYCQAHNRPREDIIGKTVAGVWGREIYDTQIKKHLNECFAGNETNYQVWFEFAALGLRCLDVTYYPYYDDEGTVTHAVVISRDVTERKRATDALQRAHAQNQQLLASISSILISVSSSGQITHWNTWAEKAFGMAASHAIDKPFLECGIQWDWAEIGDHIANCRNENRPTHLNDIPYTRLDGKDGFLNITLTPVLGDDPAQPGFLLLGKDITNRKILEMQLAQAKKLEAIGQLAAGIAHEINTPIQYVGHNARFVQDAFASISNTLTQYQRLLEAVQSGSVSQELIVEVQNTVNKINTAYLSKEIASAARQSLEGIDRVAEIVRAMRGFSHPGVGGKALTDINDAIKGAVTVTRNEWKHIAQVEMDFDFSLPLVPCIPGEFSQVIVNMIVNAVHAIADIASGGTNVKGKIAISTRQDGDWIEIRVHDTGTGIPKEVQPKVFDPFFTTKDVGQGTGQGLSIAHNVIVEKHRGMITLESEVGKGTTFIVRLPIKEPELVP